MWDEKLRWGPLLFACLLFACSDGQGHAHATTHDAGRSDASATAVQDCGTCAEHDAGPPKAVCMPGMQSKPGAGDDPCPQNTPQCPPAMYVAVTTCDANGAWMTGANGGIVCKCLPRNAVGGAGGFAGIGAMSPTCGDGIITPMTGEECDGPNLQGASCASLGFFSGTLLCDPKTCRFEIAKCSVEVP